MTRGTRGQVRRAINRLFTRERREFPSASDPNMVYEAVIMDDGQVRCNCRGWTIKKDGKPRQCKHTVELIGGRAIHRADDYLYLAS